MLGLKFGGVEPKIGGKVPPKWMVENNGKPH